jgi:hypothetical protein
MVTVPSSHPPTDQQAIDVRIALRPNEVRPFDVVVLGPDGRATQRIDVDPTNPEHAVILRATVLGSAGLGVAPLVGFSVEVDADSTDLVATFPGVPLDRIEIDHARLKGDSVFLVSRGLQEQVPAQIDVHGPDNTPLAESLRSVAAEFDSLPDQTRAYLDSLRSETLEPNPWDPDEVDAHLAADDAVLQRLLIRHGLTVRTSEAAPDTLRSSMAQLARLGLIAANLQTGIAVHGASELQATARRRSNEFRNGFVGVARNVDPELLAVATASNATDRFRREVIRRSNGRAASQPAAPAPASRRPPAQPVASRPASPEAPAASRRRAPQPSDEVRLVPTGMTELPEGYIAMRVQVIDPRRNSNGPESTRAPVVAAFAHGKPVGTRSLELGPPDSTNDTLGPDGNIHRDAVRVTDIMVPETATHIRVWPQPSASGWGPAQQFAATQGAVVGIAPGRVHDLHRAAVAGLDTTVQRARERFRMIGKQMNSPSRPDGDRVALAGLVTSAVSRGPLSRLRGGPALDEKVVDALFERFEDVLTRAQITHPRNEHGDHLYPTAALAMQAAAFAALAHRDPDTWSKPADDAARSWVISALVTQADDWAFPERPDQTRGLLDKARQAFDGRSDASGSVDGIA